jgi:hypothetical protein
VRRLVIAVFVVGALVATCGALAARRHVDRVRYTEPIARVEIDSGIGDVTVVGSHRTDIVVTHRYHFVVGRPSLGRQITNAGLQLSSRCPRLDVACTVATRVEVPEGTRVVVRVQAGGVEVRRLRAQINVRTDGGGVSIVDSTGPVTARAGTGLVRLTRVRGPLTLRTDKGDVVLDEVQGRTRVTAQEGDIRGTCLAGGDLDGFAESGIVSLSFAQRPTHVRVRTRVGGVAVRVPSGPYAIRADADAGKVRVTGVTRDPGESALIDVRAGAGDVVIRDLTRSSARSVSELRCGTGGARPRR